MSKKITPLLLEEKSGEQFSDLLSAQREALQPFARGLATVLHGLLEKGDLVVQDGRVTIPITQQG